MKLKTLLLGSAGALAIAGGAAQAADLSVAEPVEYVKIVDAFGVGYWYIPGTDTCMKIGAYIPIGGPPTTLASIETIGPMMIRDNASLGDSGTSGVEKDNGFGHSPPAKYVI